MRLEEGTERPTRMSVATRSIALAQVTLVLSHRVLVRVNGFSVKTDELCRHNLEEV